MRISQSKNIISILLSVFIFIGIVGCGKNNIKKNKKLYKIGEVVQIDKGVSMIYRGIDSEGCKIFSIKSNSKNINTAIYYITKDKIFSIDRNLANCKTKN